MDYTLTVVASAPADDVIAKRHQLVLVSTLLLLGCNPERWNGVGGNELVSFMIPHRVPQCTI